MIISETKNDYLKYLQPEAVSRLGRLDLIARLVVDGFLTGLHRSPYHGFSVEFSEYRACQPGEPIKHIDWKILARTERYYKKLFEEETNLRSCLLLDCSASMGFNSGGLSKFEYAGYLAAALSYLMLKQKDAVGLTTYSTQLKTYLPPRARSGTLAAILGQITKTTAGGKTDSSAIFHLMAEKMKQRGLIIIISDLLEEVDKIVSGLKHLRHRGHEVLVFHILDPVEISLDYTDDTLFIDLESKDDIRVNPWQVKDYYQREFQNFLNKISHECRNLKIDYTRILTSEPFDTALFRYLAGRKRLGG